jgi:hypothetical protein
MKSGRLLKVFVDSLEMTAVCVIARPDRQAVMIRAARDPSALVERVGADIYWTRWARPDHSRMIVDDTNAQLPKLHGRWLGVTPAVASKAVEIVAGELGAQLTTDVDLQERAAAAVRLVEMQIECMKASGELRAVTRAYRAYRLARAAEGRAAQSWCAWFANWKAQMVRAAAVAVR